MWCYNDACRGKWKPLLHFTGHTLFPFRGTRITHNNRLKLWISSDDAHIPFKSLSFNSHANVCVQFLSSLLLSSYFSSAPSSSSRCFFILTQFYIFSSMCVQRFFCTKISTTPSFSSCPIKSQVDAIKSFVKVVIYQKRLRSYKVQDSIFSD